MREPSISKRTFVASITLTIGVWLSSSAKAQMDQEAAGHTLQPTALVNEAWLRLQNERGAQSDGCPRASP